MAQLLRRAEIVGLGAYVPERILTNAELATLVDTNDEWIVSRTGIQERRIAAENEATSDMGYRAALEALRVAGLSPSDVDVVIVGTCTPDFNHFPATAMLVQDKLGAPKATAFDISTACAGFAYGLDLGAQFIETGRAETVVVIGAEKMSSVVDWTDRTTCILFGDGAGAVVLRASQSDAGLLASHLAADGSGGCLLEVPAGGSKAPLTAEGLAQKHNKLMMRGKEVFRFGVEVMGESALRAIEKAGLTPEDVDLLIPHQANIRIIAAAAKRMGLIDPDGMLSPKVVANVDRYGNTSAASVPIAMVEAWQQGRIQPGNIVTTIGFGAGLAWGANVIRWGNL